MLVWYLGAHWGRPSGGPKGLASVLPGTKGPVGELLASAEKDMTGYT